MTPVTVAFSLLFPQGCRVAFNIELYLFYLMKLCGYMTTASKIIFCV